MVYPEITNLPCLNRTYLKNLKENLNSDSFCQTEVTMLDSGVTGRL